MSKLFISPSSEKIQPEGRSRNQQHITMINAFVADDFSVHTRTHSREHANAHRHIAHTFTRAPTREHYFSGFFFARAHTHTHPDTHTYRHTYSVSVCISVSVSILFLTLLHCPHPRVLLFFLPSFCAVRICLQLLLSNLQFLPFLCLSVLFTCQVFFVYEPFSVSSPTAH